jgi:Arc/MetJ-type ribon-helix-helix transcriptional regulator
MPSYQHRGRAAQGRAGTAQYKAVSRETPTATGGSIAGMKVSVSLPEEEVAYLDAYAKEHGMDSRSAVVHKAVGALRASELTTAYEDAWTSWAASDDAAAWEVVDSEAAEADGPDS